jgi:hypothetical protein
LAASKTVTALLGLAFRVGLAGLAGAGLPVVAHAQEGHRTDLVNRLSLRVCADPANMP